MDMTERHTGFIICEVVVYIYTAFKIIIYLNSTQNTSPSSKHLSPQKQVHYYKNNFTSILGEVKAIYSILLWQDYINFSYHILLKQHCEISVLRENDKSYEGYENMKC